MVSSGQESMSLSSSLLLWWLSLSRWSFPLVELTLSDWCMMLAPRTICHWGWCQSVNIFYLVQTPNWFPILRAPLLRHWPGVTNERPRGISTSYLWSPVLTSGRVLRVGAAISICRETDFIRITLRISDDGNMVNYGPGWELRSEFVYTSILKSKTFKMVIIGSIANR